MSKVQASVGEYIVNFQERTKLHYVLVFPIMHKIAVKLFVEDFGIKAALKHYEKVVASLTSDGIIRESQFEHFRWPDVPPEDVRNAHEFDVGLWELARDLIANGILKEVISTTLLNLALGAASKGLDPLVSAGFLITVAKELRAGRYTPAPEIRPNVPDGTDQATNEVFNRLADLVYLFKERSGLEWQHLLPGMQKVCVVCTIRYGGTQRALELFSDQLRQLDPLLPGCKKNPPQDIPLTPAHIQNMALFNEGIKELTENFITKVGIHPVVIAHALSILITKLAPAHYDLIFLSAILTSSCIDIEEGQFDYVVKTH